MNNLYKHICEVPSKITYQCQLCGKIFDTTAEAFNCVGNCMITAANRAADILAEQCQDPDGPCPFGSTCKAGVRCINCRNINQVEILKKLAQK